MPFFERGDVTIYYEEHGSGFPVLLLAPGGMRSAISFWERAPWNPIEQLASRYRVIAMDQRNAGQSRAPISAGDSWDDYAADQLALLDHLGADRFHALGMCIGGAFVLKLLATAPERVVAAAAWQPIGVSSENPAALPDMFDAWADEVRAQHPEAHGNDWASFRESMYGGGRRFFSVTETQIQAIRTPTVLLAGNDLYHPLDASRALTEMIPGVVFFERWKEPEHQPPARAAVDELFAAHTPA